MASKPRRWTMLLYCDACGKEERVSFNAVVRTSDLADAARRAAGWNLNAAGLVYHATCPKKAA